MLYNCISTTVYQTLHNFITASILIIFFIIFQNTKETDMFASCNKAVTLKIQNKFLFPLKPLLTIDIRVKMYLSRSSPWYLNILLSAATITSTLRL